MTRAADIKTTDKVSGLRQQAADRGNDMEESKQQRLQEVLSNIRCEAEEALFLTKYVETDKGIIAALDRVIRVLNEC